MVEITYIGYDNSSSPLELKKYELPSSLGPDELLLKVTYGALNPVDIKLKSIPVIGPKKLFLEFSGYVEKVGSDLTGEYTVGERLSVRSGIESTTYVGAYAVIKPKGKASVLRAPSRLSDAEAAAFPLTYGTAAMLFEKLKLTPESRLLILGGATVVGKFAIQIAKYFHNIKNITVTASPRSFEAVKRIGASEVVDYNQPSYIEALVQSVANGGRYQAIIDCVGGYDTVAVSDKLLTPASEGSYYVSVDGDSPPDTPYSSASVLSQLLTFPRMIFRSLFGSYYGLNYALILVKSGEWEKTVDEFFSIPNVVIPIDSEWPLEDFRKAWERIDSGKAQGKVLIKLN